MVSLAYRKEKICMVFFIFYCTAHCLVCSKLTQVCGDQTGISYISLWRHLPLLCILKLKKKASYSWLQSPPSLSTDTAMLLHVQWPLQARDKLPPGAEDGSFLAQFLVQSVTLNILKMSDQLFPKQGFYTQSLHTIQEEDQSNVYSSWWAGYKGYRNYGTKTHAWNCTCICGDI